MKQDIVFLVDENEEQRRAYVRALNDLFGGDGLIIKEMAPLPSIADYASIVADSSLAALILDQRMEDGGVAYSGTQLSAHLRGIVSKLPIFILSNYTDDSALFEEGEGDVEYIISKKDIADPTGRAAQVFRARFLRRLRGFSDVLGARAQRFHDLLVKSLREKLTPAEELEMGMLETDRVIPQQAMEIGDIKALETAIAEIRKRIQPD